MPATSSEPDRALDRKHKFVIFASSVGTVFEWYDFYIYGSLAVFFGKHFFPPGNDAAAFLSSLALFGVGFSVRPFGALVFGHLGDRVGRKYTFLVTITVMGLATALIGVLPSYSQIGFVAPLLLVLLRVAQGLALGGEYGGAATYVAEHAPARRRGAFTSWIQTTATLGFFLSLVVILGIRSVMSPASFASWGWRLPFLVSIVLLAISVVIRLRLAESPAFAEIKAQGKLSASPLAESFARRKNLAIVLRALFGATAGQGVVWYAGQFYALYFLTTTLKVDYRTGYWLIAIALVVGSPLLLIFGRLSDRIGRKPVLLGGLALAALTYQPIFHGLARAANPALVEAMERAPVVLATEDFHGRKALAGEALMDAARKIVLPSAMTGGTDKARKFLNDHGIPFTLTPPVSGAPITLLVGGRAVPGFDPGAYAAALAPAGYPAAADPGAINWPMVITLLVLLMAYVAMVYGPIAAFLVELFPTRIRYTSMSLPYHIGNGWFGGFLPLIAASIVFYTGDIYAGLWFPIGVAGAAFLIGLFVLPETYLRDLRD